MQHCRRLGETVSHAKLLRADDEPKTERQSTIIYIIIYYTIIYIYMYMYYVDLGLGRANKVFQPEVFRERNPTLH